MLGAFRLGGEEPGDVERICRRGQEQPWCQMRAHFGLQPAVFEGSFAMRIARVLWMQRRPEAIQAFFSTVAR